MTCILALDQGTSSSRALIFDESGGILATVQQPTEQIYPRPGWVEQDPEQIWATQRDVARQALAQAGQTAGDVAAIGIANQRETVVLWERTTGRPLHNAIVWQDRRTADHVQRLRAAGHEAHLRERTGLVLDPYFSATKIAWLLDHVTDARRRAEAGELAVGTIDSWLLWKLTDGAAHATDVTNACRTQLFDLGKLAWDDGLLGLFDVPRSLLPEVHPSSGILAHTTADLFGAEIPVAGIAGDQQAALFGQQCTRPGMAKNTYGTGSFLLLHTGEVPAASATGLLTTMAWQLGDTAPEFALEGSVFTTGAAIQWLRDGLGIIDTAPQVNELAASVADAGGVWVVPAFAGLGAPHWDPAARGTILGLAQGSTAAHIARATLEGIAFQVADVLNAMEIDACRSLAELRVDGGAAASDLLMQLQADLIGVPVVRPTVTETTALGAANLAGLGIGVWPDISALAAGWQVERTFEPAVSEDERQQRQSHWQRAVERARGWTDP
ncbi:MAG: glycerol kinase GlpK [Candidatus Latescibacterota bacterium]